MQEHILEFFGRFHPLVVHLPIGILLLAFVFEWLSRKPQYNFLQDATEQAYLYATLSAIVSCVAGYLLSLSGGYDETTLNQHKWLGIGVAVASGALWLFKKISLPAVFKRVTVVITAVGLALTGHLGGSLTHGDDYLSQPLAAAFNGETGSGKSQRKPITDLNQAMAYQDVVEPILAEKCYQCHNDKKQKGGLRMDSPEFLQKGGENGVVFLAGNIEKSKLCEYLTLPEGDDMHMPPKGKPQPTPQEIALINWWVKQGAPFDKKVAELPQDEQVKPILAALASGSTEGTTAAQADVPTDKVPAADAAALEALKSLNVLVMPVANESNYLMANMVNTPAFDDQQVSKLVPLAKQLVWLRLGGTKVSDAGLKEIGKLQNLTRLSLEHTTVSDAGLEALKGLSNLQYLNLFDTKVSDKGLQALASLKNLRTVYVYQTQVTAQGVGALQKNLPSLKIDTGGYQKQLLAIADTAKGPEVEKKAAEQKAKK
jgi:uncharacterized membrane protein